MDTTYLKLKKMDPKSKEALKFKKALLRKIQKSRWNVVLTALKYNNVNFEMLWQTIIHDLEDTNPFEKIFISCMKENIADRDFLDLSASIIKKRIKEKTNEDISKIYLYESSLVDMRKSRKIYFDRNLQVYRSNMHGVHAVMFNNENRGNCIEKIKSYTRSLGGKTEVDLGR